MLISSNPRILAFNDDNVAQTRDIMDFWRPNYSTTPYVNGLYSTQQYLDSLKTTWTEYQKRHKLALKDFAAYCFHLPYPKLLTILGSTGSIGESTLFAPSLSWAEANASSPILVVLAIGIIFQGIWFTAQRVMLAYSDTKRLLIADAVVGIVPVILCLGSYLLLPANY